MQLTMVQKRFLDAVRNLSGGRRGKWVTDSAIVTWLDPDKTQGVTLESREFILSARALVDGGFLFASWKGSKRRFALREAPGKDFRSLSVEFPMEVYRKLQEVSKISGLPLRDTVVGLVRKYGHLPLSKEDV